MRLAQRVTVLRDGRVTLAGVRREDVGVPDLVTAMLGGAPPQQPVGGRVPVAVGPRARRAGGGVPCGRLGRDLSRGAGEVVGVAGLQGAGHRRVGGGVRAYGRLGPRRRPGDAAAPAGRGPGGVAFVPSDRKRYGLMTDRRCGRTPRR